MSVRVFAAFFTVTIALAAMSGCARHPASKGAPGPAPSITGADVSRGRTLYERECMACHGQRGVDGPIGPALKDERARKSFEQVRAIVSDPQPPMPKLYPARLTRADVRDVSAYVETL